LLFHFFWNGPNPESIMDHRPTNASLPRRRFLRTIAGGAAVAAWSRHGVTDALAADSEGQPLSFGLVTDVHYADASARGSRHYRDSLAKLEAAIRVFNERKVSFVVELGDLIDAGPGKAAELDHLRTIDRVYQAFRGERHYVLGNHCLGALSKSEFLANCGAAIKKSFYSFDCAGFHFVVLDANFTRDGTPYAAGNFSWTDSWIHSPQQQWLAEDLGRSRGRKTFVFLHQNLHDENDPHGVKNAPDVRRILEGAGSVVAVFQGHMHSGGYAKVGAVHYCTLKAMVEGPGPGNNAFAVVTLNPSGGAALEGFGRQQDARME
jgi:alkaline phosphatase